MPATARNANLHAAATGDPAAAIPANVPFQPVQMAVDGALYTAITAQAAGAGGDSEPVSFDAYELDGILPSFAETGGMVVSAGVRALNAAGNVDRGRFLASDADAQVAAQLGLLGSVARAQYFNGATWDRARSLASDTDAQAAAQVGLAGAVMRPYIYNGASYDRQRAPALVNSQAVTAAGNTLAVAGVAGQTIRLLRYCISITSNVAAAAAAVLVVDIQDTAAGSFGVRHGFFVPAAAVLTGFGMHTTGWIDLGPLGLLGAVGSGVNINLSFALTAGRVDVVLASIRAVNP